MKKPAVRSRTPAPARLSPEVKGRLDAAMAAAARGDTTEALTTFRAAWGEAQAGRMRVPAASAYRFGLMLREAQALEEAEAVVGEAASQHPDDGDLANLLGVVLKGRQRYPEALVALARAEKLNPRSVSPLVNQGNVHLAMGNGPRAVDVFRQVLRRNPGDAETMRLLGMGHRLAREYEEALRMFELARRTDPASDRAWVDAAGLLKELGRFDEALVVIERGVAQARQPRSLRIAKAQVLRAAGRHGEAAAHLQAMLQASPEDAHLHLEMGRLVAASDQAAANTFFREAVRLAPGNLDMAVRLADSLDRTRGPQEGAHIEEAYRVARHALTLEGDLKPHLRFLRSILERCADYDAAAGLGGFEEMARYWALNRDPAALLHHLPRVETARDRRVLVEAHRLWGRGVEEVAARTPLEPRPRPPRRERIRIGVMSSDLRNHPVSYFALPLLEGYDRARFELYAYSWCSEPEDRVQQHIASRVDAFRLRPQISARDAARLIAEDDVDILFELGATTHMNKLEVMAWKPAPVQVSWLGYPHSSGLSTIDHILVDPWLKPQDPALLIEKPFEVPHTWVTLGRLGFHDGQALEPGLPEARRGFLTFGTMNNPYKYNRRLLETWAGIVARVPGSRFLFVRPEGAVAAFRDNVCRIFEQAGVARERVLFEAVRGTHLPHYNAIDIALDTFPQTGGTTTCECLWMGVPVITLVGETFFERLSYSNLVNAGLPELCAFDLPAYVEKAVALAEDRPRREALRADARARLRAHPLGQAERFVREFEDTVVRCLEAGS